MIEIGNAQPDEPIEFTAEQWADSTAYLWDQAFQASELRSAIEPRVDELYEALSRPIISGLSAKERQARAEAEEHYWDTYGQMQALKEREATLFTTLERVESGEATAEEIIALLPQEEPDEQGEEAQSKRRQAIERQQKANRSQLELDCSAFLLGILTTGPGSMPIAGTDPRRIASGRNRTKLVAGRGINIYEAEGAFIEATADTHGGKSRRPGKNGQYYIGASGRRVRKH
jgi:hypothetical protein